MNSNSSLINKRKIWKSKKCNNNRISKNSKSNKTKWLLINFKNSKEHKLSSKKILNKEKILNLMKMNRRMKQKNNLEEESCNKISRELKNLNLRSIKKEVSPKNKKELNLNKERKKRRKSLMKILRMKVMMIQVKREMMQRVVKIIHKNK